VVESPTAARFPPLTVHYAETFIVPASAGLYTIRPVGAAAHQRCATIKATSGLDKDRFHHLRAAA